MTENLSAVDLIGIAFRLPVASNCRTVPLWRRVKELSSLKGAARQFTLSPHLGRQITLRTHMKRKRILLIVIALLVVALGIGVERHLLSTSAKPHILTA